MVFRLRQRDAGIVFEQLYAPDKRCCCELVVALPPLKVCRDHDSVEALGKSNQPAFYPGTIPPLQNRRHPGSITGRCVNDPALIASYGLKVQSLDCSSQS